MNIIVMPYLEGSIDHRLTLLLPGNGIRNTFVLLTWTGRLSEGRISYNLPPEPRFSFE